MRLRSKPVQENIDFDEIRLVDECSSLSIASSGSKKKITSEACPLDNIRRPEKRKIVTNNKIEVVALIHDEPKNKKFYCPSVFDEISSSGLNSTEGGFREDTCVEFGLGEKLRANEDTLMLVDDDIAITGEKIQTILKAANVDVEPYWPGLFAKALALTSGPA
ncbi:hypothetical protein JTB14_011763 [Gonioctena quinquepunctata]|nr:hypothetical protein JTB14_011763 [Gonioctena quinquepunctata]